MSFCALSSSYRSPRTLVWAIGTVSAPQGRNIRGGIRIRHPYKVGYIYYVKANNYLGSTVFSRKLHSNHKVYIKSVNYNSGNAFIIRTLRLIIKTCLYFIKYKPLTSLLPILPIVYSINMGIPSIITLTFALVLGIFYLTRKNLLSYIYMILYYSENENDSGSMYELFFACISILTLLIIILDIISGYAFTNPYLYGAFTTIFIVSFLSLHVCRVLSNNTLPYHLYGRPNRFLEKWYGTKDGFIWVSLIGGFALLVVLLLFIWDVSSILELINNIDFE